jgi:hypothetical protein
MMRAAVIALLAGAALVALAIADAVGAPSWITPAAFGVALILAGLFGVDVDRRPLPPPHQDGTG